MKEIFNKDVVSFDIETTGLSPYKGAEIFAFCVGYPVYEAGEIVDCKVDVFRLDNKDKGINRTNWEIMQEIFKDIHTCKIAHNYKFEYTFLKYYGIDIPENTVWHDTMLQSQILRNLNISHALDNLCYELCGFTKEKDNKVKLMAKAIGGNYKLIPKSLMTKYQIADGQRPVLLHFTQYPYLLENEKMLDEYKIEIELVRVAYEMEKNGLQLSKKNLDYWGNRLIKELDKVSEEIFGLTGEYVNLSSDPAVARLLYRKYKFSVYKFTDGKKLSTDKEILLKLQAETKHPIFDLIFKQRSYVKALATIRSYRKFANEDLILRPNINTNRARTSRQSCSKPNLHNVNKEEVIKNPFPVPLRKCFRTTKKHFLLMADYKGIEMRLIINVTKEKELFDLLLRDPDADMHHPTVECFMMKKIFNYKEDEIFIEGIEKADALKKLNYKQYNVFRDTCKNTGFAIAYGAGTEKVAIILGKAIGKILTGDRNYRKRFPKITNFNQFIVYQVKQNGFIETSFGRKLNVPIDKPYIGANYLIQGTASGILKRAQVRIAKFLKKECNDLIIMNLSIHDEIMFNFPLQMIKHKDSILSEISKIMIDMPEIEIPLRVEWKQSTTNWNDAKKIEVIY